MSARAPRFPANYPVVVRKGPEIYQTVICNISVGGACLLGVEKMDKGDTMTVDYEFGQTRATVTWKTGKMAGIMFDDRLSDSGLQFIRGSQSFAS